ncbi:MAG: HNH endonuclease [Aphanocapsa feldmannii 277cV]|uniref:HNH endonuclease n=1 Tax=Aphanocapsa feldmannii 277cV TaxID=2507553 RepID=A0A524RKI3_9CHRO|nr:MAG: HNH endonuclease [Aphanocapsa feldmannii 277cV]
MRRVDRGPWPLDEKNPEKRKRFHPNKKYQEARADLFARLGDYCSYCERCRSDLHVEHVIPRNHREDLAGEWTNFLLGCKNCNGTKKDRNRSRNGYLWPDERESLLDFSRYSSAID